MPELDDAQILTTIREAIGDQPDPVAVLQGVLSVGGSAAQTEAKEASAQPFYALAAQVDEKLQVAVSALTASATALRKRFTDRADSIMDGADNGDGVGQDDIDLIL